MAANALEPGQATVSGPLPGAAFGTRRGPHVPGVYRFVRHKR
jgi:hypothetical protein